MTGHKENLRPRLRSQTETCLMQNFLRFSSLAAAALAFSAFGPRAGAQELRNHDLCRQTSTYPPEQLGDRDGHMLNSGMDSCETVEGVTKGAIWTSYIMWEWDRSEERRVGKGC